VQSGLEPMGYEYDTGLCRAGLVSRRPARRGSWAASVLPADPVDRRVLGAVAAARLVAMPAASLAIVAGGRTGRGIAVSNQIPAAPISC